MCIVNSLYRWICVCTGDFLELYCIGDVLYFVLENVCNSIGDIYVCVSVFDTNACAGNLP